ncbi:MAG: hypothetical protein IJB16_07220, partial [Clostridia bacterium]|nr:hypothetical protein [Clostridia bacterium]
MNELSKLFQSIKDGDNLILKKNKTYHVRQDDSFELEGYYCSNTAKKHENPNGLRRTAMFLGNKKNIVIDGNDASVIVHGKMTPIIFDCCENITVRNLTIDYACPTMAEFKVVSYEKGEYILKINAECLFRVEDNSLIWQGENDKNGNPYWEDCYNSNKRYIKVFDPVTEKCSDK